MKKIINFLFTFITLSFAYSQNKVCGASELHTHLMSNPQYAKDYRVAQQKIYDAVSKLSGKNLDDNNVYNLPVVVHVIHTGEALGTDKNPSDEQIQNYISALNKAFSATFPGYPSISNGGVDIGIQFVLAKRTPDCQSTNGIERINASSNTKYANNGVSVYNNPNAINWQELTNLAYWDNTKYLNIWLINKIYESQFSGFSYYPTGTNTIYDGTVIVSSDVKFGDPYLNAHELGHAFDLRHTFEGDTTGNSCPANNNCLLDGDMVCDTDPMIENINCNSSLTNVCTGLPLGNLVYNYMNYYACHQLFTQGQKDRMRNALLTLRPTLITSLGGQPPSQVTPSINITPSTNIVCQGQSITIAANVSNGGNSAIYQWYINNNIVGSNSNTFTYTPNNNDIVYCKLTSSNSCAFPQNVNSNSISISVLPNTQLTAYLTSSATTVCKGTQITATVSSTGFNNPSYTWFVDQSPVSTTNTPTFNFTPTNYETLFCRVSENSPSNCQSSSFVNSNLIYYVAIPQPTQPTILQIDNFLKVTNYQDGQGNWYNASTGQPILGASNQIFYPTESGLYYFVVNNNGCINQSQYINYIYLSISESDNQTDLKIFPNPAYNFLNIFANKKITDISIFDITGKALIINAKITNGKIDISKLTEGVYFISFKIDNGNKFLKFIKN